MKLNKANVLGTMAFSLKLKVNLKNAIDMIISQFALNLID